MMDNNIDYSKETILKILKLTEELHQLKDVDTILDFILYESRKLSNADAGSIFLVEQDKLRFSYVHNDTLFREAESNAALYVDYTIPINDQSIVGNVALSGKMITLEDVYHLPDNLSYRFDSSFDRKSGYRTKSVFTIPLKTFENKIVGVMQLINAKDQDNNIVPFSKECEIYIPLFANNATMAIEHGIMNRELILRMMKMAEMRDPKETGAHVQRVGAYSAEIYQRWAVKHGVERKEMKRYRDLIRLAAMLHDVGKVGISDTILKKPAKLTDEEFEIMKYHTILGAKLFIHETSEMDTMCRDIALNHHEKWNGEGYPGWISNLSDDNIQMGKPKKGEEIPLCARITALADVFDALGSKRSYKASWSDDRIFSELYASAGTHFDPELVSIFFEILDVIKAIRDKFRD